MQTYPATSSRQARPQLPALQILRFFAAFAVVMVHIGSGIAIEYNIGRELFSSGTMGVDVFFVLSGFIIAYTARPEKGFGYFMQRRIARVVPLYWLLTLGLISIAFVAPFLLNATTVTPLHVVTSLLFIPHLKSSGAIQPILFLGWTLCYEMFFYLVFALALVTKRRVTLVASAVLIAIVILGKLFPSDAALWRFYTSPILLEFVFGMVIFEIFERIGTETRNTPLAIALILIGIGIHILAFDHHRVIAGGIPAIFIVGGFLLLSLPATPVVSGLVLLGDASYSLYLAHPYFIQVGVKVFGKEYGMLVTVLAVSAAAIAAIIGSVLLYKLIERPAQKWILKSPIWTPQYR